MRILFKKMGKPYIALLSGIITLIFMFIIMPGLDSVRPLGTLGIIEFQLSFTEEKFSNIINQWGIDTVNYYVKNLWIDYIYPIMYAVFLSSSIALLTKKKHVDPSKFYIILFTLPILAGVLDWIENTLHLILLHDINNLSKLLIFLAAITASIKWSFALFSFIIIIYYLIVKLLKKY